MDTMLLADEAAHLAGMLRPPVLTADTALLAGERIQTGLERAFGDAWAGLSPAAQHVCKRVAAGVGPYRRPAPNPAQIKRGLAGLISAGLLENPARGEYHFVEKMFAAYVQRRWSAN